MEDTRPKPRLRTCSSHTLPGLRYSVEFGRTPATIHHTPAEKPLALQTSLSSLPAKDRRILRALINRFAADEKLTRLQRESELLRIQQREVEAYEREARQKRRQRRLLDAQKAFDSSRSTVRSRQASLCEAEEAQKKASEADKWEKRQAAARLQAAQQAQVLLERRAIEHKKKLRQEELKRHLEWRDALHRSTLEDYMREVEYGVGMKRETEKKWKAQQRLVRSEEKKQQFSMRRVQLEKEENHRQQLLKSSIDDRLLHAQKLHYTQLVLRDAQLKSAEQRRNQCVLRLQMAARELEMKLQAWQSEVDDHIHKCMLRGQEASQRLNKERRLRAQLGREGSRKKHEVNLQRVREGEELRKKQTALDIDHQRERWERMVFEKQAALDKSRQAARTSAELRDQVKNFYLRKSFDKMALEGQLYASWDRGTHSTLKGTPRVN